MTSLRARAVTGGILWAVITTVLGLFTLASYMSGQSEARFVELLQTRHTQAIVTVANNASTPDEFARAIGDPVYQRPFSGQYWQISGDDGALYVSPSLVDALLPFSENMTEQTIMSEVTLSDGETLLCISQWLVMGDGSRWNVQVASSLESLEAEKAVLRRNLLWAFGIVTAIGIIGALMQVAVVLKPLDALREDVADRWEHEDGLNIDGYPTEVTPLVTDINTLLERNRGILRSSRRQAADLAHAIKTPSAIMRNELAQLDAKGLNVTDSLDALDRLDAQLKRSFARMRADGSEGAVGSITDLDTALGRMERAFTALARNADRSFEANIEAGLRVRMDQSDVEEVVGNLLDNAVKWSKSRLSLTAKQGAKDHTVIITIADDGPGIAPTEHDLAASSGQRLDVSKPGTGLGLAIASDLVHAYGGEIALGVSSELGGLSVQLSIPMPGGRRLG